MSSTWFRNASKQGSDIGYADAVLGRNKAMEFWYNSSGGSVSTPGTIFRHYFLWNYFLNIFILFTVNSSILCNTWNKRLSYIIKIYNK